MKRRLIIEGEKVQDIGYRMFLLNLAGEHDLTGFQARNVGKKAVEALYEGDDGAVRAFEDDVREMAPEGARVDRIHFEDYDGPIKDIERFRSHFMTLQLGKMIEVGLTMIQELRAFREESKQNQETMIQNQQLMIQKQDETLEELKGIRKDLKSILDRRLAELERDVALIKERLGIE
ncbi:MAG: acylphosphatase [Candidatus Korarchaeota archaeon]|nr:acylphosphatase [Candidatus Korarchaeota archaeon]